MYWFVNPYNPEQAVDLHELESIDYSHVAFPTIEFRFRSGSVIIWNNIGSSVKAKETYEFIIRILQEPRVRTPNVR